MKINRLRIIPIAFCCLVVAVLSGAQCADHRERQQSQLPPIANLSIQDHQKHVSPLETEDFELIRNRYNSQNEIERQNGRLLMRNIATNMGNINQFKALEILLKSNNLEESQFSKNYLFDMILFHDVYGDQQNVTNAARILLKSNNFSIRLVGARRLIEDNMYRNEAADLLRGSSFCPDVEKAYQAYHLIAEDETEEINKRFNIANILYPINRLNRVGFSSVLRERQITDDDKNIALRVYRILADQPIIINQILESRLYSASELNSFDYSGYQEPLQRHVKKLYDVAKFLLEEPQDFERSLNTFKRIADIYQHYAISSYAACKKLDEINFNKYRQIILEVYNHIFKNLDLNNLGCFLEYKPLDRLLESDDDSHKITALETYWNLLEFIENNLCRDGEKIRVEDVIKIQETLVMKGSIAFVTKRFPRDDGIKRADIAALDNIYWLFGYVQNERFMNNTKKFTAKEIYEFQKAYRSLLPIPNPRPNDPEFSDYYVRVYNRIHGLEQRGQNGITIPFAFSRR